MGAILEELVERLDQLLIPIVYLKSKMTQYTPTISLVPLISPSSNYC